MLLDPEIKPPTPKDVDNSPYELERDMPQRIVVVGDLNAQYPLLRRYLMGLRVINKRGSWCGGKTLFVQMGDIPNRGSSARAAMDLMMGLRRQARDAGGDAVWLLGNHEVMSILGHEAYVTADEYMEFATPEDVDDFYLERTRYLYELLGSPDTPGLVRPLGGKMQAWEEEHAPGQANYRKEMGADGFYGAFVRKLPLAFRVGTLLFVHGGLSPTWADYGLSGLQRQAELAWQKKPRFYQDLDPNGIFRDPLGPLWHRAYCVSNASLVRKDLREALKVVGAAQMLVGHTRTDSVENGKVSHPLARQRGRLVMTDVGLGDGGEIGSALVIEKGRIEMWTPGGSRSRIVDVKKK